MAKKTKAAKKEARKSDDVAEPTPTSPNLNSSSSPKPKPMPSPEFKPSSGSDVRKLFVGGVRKIPESDLRSAFEKFGTISEFLLPLNRRKQPQGMAFVTFDKDKSANKALTTLNNAELLGYTITVKVREDKAAGTKTVDNFKKHHELHKEKKRLVKEAKAKAAKKAGATEGLKRKHEEENDEEDEQAQEEAKGGRRPRFKAKNKDGKNLAMGRKNRPGKVPYGGETGEGKSAKVKKAKKKRETQKNIDADA